jgi:hypothetical protein
VEQAEDDHRDAEKDEDALHEPAKDVGGHRLYHPSPCPLP